MTADTKDDMTGVVEQSLEQRIAALEAIEAIKSLKHRYLRACDAKEPETFRSCFIKKGATVDYGPKVGKHEDAADLVQVFVSVGLKQVDGHYVNFDMHHGLHPEIRLVSETEAEGKWTLRFRQVSVLDGVERVSAIEYADSYVVEDGEWKMSRCLVTVLWTISRPLPEGYEITGSLA